jgi:hypothetical protein
MLIPAVRQAWVEWITKIFDIMIKGRSCIRGISLFRI